MYKVPLMRGKDHLFHLIHSLSKSEKRYFTLDARKGGKTHSRYLELFQLINKQNSYEETPLKKQFGTRLGDDKARLYEAILGAMREYQSKKSYKIRIKELLTDAKILFERKLYDQSENRLNEAKELAMELQDHLAVLEINLRQRQLMREHLGKDYAEKVETLIKEKDYHLGLLNTEFWLHDNYDRLSVKYLQFPYKLDDDEIDILNKKYKNVLSIDMKDLKSFLSEWRYHKFMALYFRLAGKPNLVLDEVQEIVHVWKRSPKILKEEFVLYIGDFSNLLSTISRTPNKFTKLKNYLNQLRGQKAPNPQGQKLLFERVSLYKLVYLLNSLNEPIANTIHEIETGLQLYRIAPNVEINILSNTALLLFLSDQYSECLKWTGKIWKLQRKQKNLRKDIQDYSRIIHLMCLYKIGTFEQIENEIRTTNRYFNQNKDSKFFDYSILFANTLKKLQASSSSKEERELLLNLKIKVTQFSNKTHAGLDEISLLWIDSILQRKNINELRKSS